MSKKYAASVTVRADWITRNGFGGIFKGVWATSTGNAIIQATDHGLGDPSFVEVEFSPPALNGNWMRIMIPRGAVEAIVMFERAKDSSLIGFKEPK
jgi:hypothetical protein